MRQLLGMCCGIASLLIISSRDGRAHRTGGLTPGIPLDSQTPVIACLALGNSCFPGDELTEIRATGGKESTFPPRADSDLSPVRGHHHSSKTAQCLLCSWSYLLLPTEELLYTRTSSGHLSMRYLLENSPTH